MNKSTTDSSSLRAIRFLPHTRVSNDCRRVFSSGSSWSVGRVWTEHGVIARRQRRQCTRHDEASARINNNPTRIGRGVVNECVKHTGRADDDNATASARSVSAGRTLSSKIIIINPGRGVGGKVCFGHFPRAPPTTVRHADL